MRLKISIQFLSIFLLIFSLLACQTNGTTASANEVKKEAVAGQSKDAEAAPKPAKTQKTFTYQYEVRPSKTHSEKAPALILLHGRGSNAQGFFNFAQRLDERLTVIAPQAPLAMGPNQFQWYKLDRKGPGQNFSYDGKEVVQASKDLMTFVGEMIQEYKLDPDKIYLGGFSQGGIMSLGTALTNADKIAGVTCLSGQLYPEFSEQIAQQKDFGNLSVFISHGTQDKVLTLQKIEEAARLIKKKGIKLNTNYYEVAHTMSQENYQDWAKWLSEELNQ